MYKHLVVEGFLQKMSLKKSVFREPRGSGDSDKVLQDYSRTIRSIFIRVVPDTDLAGYPPNNFAGYQISGKIVNIVFKKINKTYQHFWSVFQQVVHNSKHGIFKTKILN